MPFDTMFDIDPFSINLPSLQSSLSTRTRGCTTPISPSAKTRERSCVTLHDQVIVPCRSSTLSLSPSWIVSSLYGTYVVLKVGQYFFALQKRHVAVPRCSTFAMGVVYSHLWCAYVWLAAVSTSAALPPFVLLIHPDRTNSSLSACHTYNRCTYIRSLHGE